MKNTTLLIFYFICFIINSKAQKWEKLGDGFPALQNGTPCKIAVDKHGFVYATGYNDGYYTVFKWNGVVWSEVAGLNANGLIETIITDDVNNIYVAGQFTNSNSKNYVAKWDGVNWSELGSGSNALNANNTIFVLTKDILGNIYAAGSFTEIAPSSSDLYYGVVAKWDGNEWSIVGQKKSSWETYALAVDNSGKAYASGLINWAESSFEGSEWEVVGGKENPASFFANSYIYELAVDDEGAVYAGGAFSDYPYQDVTYAGYTYICKWDGTSWNRLDEANSNFLQSIYSRIISSVIADHSGNVFVGANYNELNPFVYGLKPYVAQWNGSNWAKVETSKSKLDDYDPLTGMALDIAGNIYVCGGSSYSATKHYYIAQWIADTTAVPLLNPSSTAVTNAFHEEIAFNIWPNPGKDIIKINISESGQLYISDLVGQRLNTLEITSGTNAIDISALSNGMYVFTFKGEGKTALQIKWLKE